MTYLTELVHLRATPEGQCQKNGNNSGFVAACLLLNKNGTAK